MPLQRPNSKGEIVFNQYPTGPNWSQRARDRGRGGHDESRRAGTEAMRQGSPPTATERPASSGPLGAGQATPGRMANFFPEILFLPALFPYTSLSGGITPSGKGVAPMPAKKKAGGKRNPAKSMGKKSTAKKSAKKKKK